MNAEGLKAPTTAQLATASPEPTPPAAIVPLASAALVGWAVAAACFWYGLSALARLVNPDGAWLATVVLAVIGALALLPLVPLAQGMAGIPRRARALAAGDLATARHQAALAREHALVTLGFGGGILIIGAILWFITTNNAAIAKTFLDTQFLEGSWGDVSAAFWINVQVAVGAEVIVLIAGLVIAIMRLLPGRAGRPLRWIATIYVDVFRAIPSIIVIYLVGFGLAIAKVPFFKDLPPTMLAIIALALTYTGYVAEVYRAGLESIHPSQWSAARSLGLSYGGTLRTVIVPQAFRRMIPPLLNDFIGLQKDTALIGIMGVVDAFMQARLYASQNFNLSPVTVVALVFVIATIPQARFVDWLIVRGQRQQKAGADA